MSKPSDDTPGGRQQLSDTQSKDDASNLQFYNHKNIADHLVCVMWHLSIDLIKAKAGTKTRFLVLVRA